jgi:hypothetical protein
MACREGVALERVEESFVHFSDHPAGGSWEGAVQGGSFKDCIGIGGIAQAITQEIKHKDGRDYK